MLLPRMFLPTFVKMKKSNLRKLAKYVLTLTDLQLSEIIENGQFEEVVKDD